MNLPPKSPCSFVRQNRDSIGQVRCQLSTRVRMVTCHVCIRLTFKARDDVWSETCPRSLGQTQCTCVVEAFQVLSKVETGSYPVS